MTIWTVWQHFWSLRKVIMLFSELKLVQSFKFSVMKLKDILAAFSFHRLEFLKLGEFLTVFSRMECITEGCWVFICCKGPSSWLEFPKMLPNIRKQWCPARTEEILWSYWQQMFFLIFASNFFKLHAKSSLRVSTGKQKGRKKAYVLSTEVNSWKARFCHLCMFSDMSVHFHGLVRDRNWSQSLWWNGQNSFFTEFRFFQLQVIREKKQFQIVEECVYK